MGLEFIFTTPSSTLDEGAKRQARLKKKARKVCGILLEYLFLSMTSARLDGRLAKFNDQTSQVDTTRKALFCPPALMLCRNDSGDSGTRDCEVSHIGRLIGDHSLVTPPCDHLTRTCGKAPPTFFLKRRRSHQNGSEPQYRTAGRMS